MKHYCHPANQHCGPLRHLSRVQANSPQVGQVPQRKTNREVTNHKFHNDHRKTRTLICFLQYTHMQKKSLAATKWLCQLNDTLECVGTTQALKASAGKSKASDVPCGWGCIKPRVMVWAPQVPPGPHPFVDMDSSLIFGSPVITRYQLVLQLGGLLP